MNEIDCSCANQQALWITVENPVDKSVSKNPHAMSLDLNLYKDLPSDIQQALIDAVDLLSARLDALELDISAILGVLNTRLPDSIDHLRQIRDQLP